MPVLTSSVTWQATSRGDLQGGVYGNGHAARPSPIFWLAGGAHGSAAVIARNGNSIPSGGGTKYGGTINGPQDLAVFGSRAA